MLTYLDTEQLVIVAAPQHDALGQAVQAHLELAVVDEILQRRLMLLLMWIGNAAAEEPLVAAAALGVLATLQPAGEAQLAGPDAALVQALGWHAQQCVEYACKAGGRRRLAERRGAGNR